ncbi:MAG: hypothetical protein HC853_17400 [Anaerolineae bacterium]|nr:hypothetical protein [Anaerolineae bacterium]
MPFEIVGEITQVETIARGTGVRVVSSLRKQYGAGNWRKMKGNATIKLLNNSYRFAELHWYEAHGIGKKRIKIKRFLD